MRRFVSFLVLFTLLLPVAAPASALPGTAWRRAEAPGATTARLAVRGLQRLVQREVGRLAGVQPRHEVRLAVDSRTISAPAPRPPASQPVLLAAQRLMDLTARSLAQVRGAPLQPPATLAV